MKTNTKKTQESAGLQNRTEQVSTERQGRIDYAKQPAPFDPRSKYGSHFPAAAKPA